MDFDDGPEKQEDEVSTIKISNGFSISRATLASMESLSLPIVQEVVVFADMQCKNCQKRVSDIITKMNETESLEVNVLEKKVTLTFRLPTVAEVMRHRQLAPITRSPFPKAALIKRLFRSLHVLH
ncbi:uncharacterized protein LOC114739248 isoform X2 [Neltuma alba]|uniref:uncharacterized protein LOC114725808 isoform X2 n=1 Tax=Neltuma alba TaxID=207710 RepID=UPI0010A37AB4|nr:uncharacterized protein LOC114725808 isoform X2 [Prosopis alba]XP_028768227.1 uncharacterized protein LOC114725821 isoform X2 [Prosopis alba]XP_028783128.1 uncharacterized protein LOC114739248 isoform X2 [Prosopis alba]